MRIQTYIYLYRHINTHTYICTYIYCIYIYTVKIYIYIICIYIDNTKGPNAHEDTVQVLTFWGEDVLQRPRWTWALDPGLLVEVMALTKKE